MADYYCQFSEELATRNQKEKDWIENHLLLFGEMKDSLSLEGHPRYEEWKKLCEYYQLDLDDEGPDFQWKIEERALWIYADEYGNPDHAARFVQLFLKEFHPEGSFSLTWSTTCSKSEVGAFGGGAVFVTAEYIEFSDTHGWCEEQRRKHARKMDRKKS